MQTLHTAINRLAAPADSLEIEVAGWFCLLGVVVSLAVLPHLDAQSAHWLVAHLE
jgi:hypothetical protein